ncbi:protein 4.2-like [Sceloporus undulatus]|uniref:protein 4.2-like n=1 Tax=Sceloporus undulatus TaxID=8520 RepID=UPI001C4B08CC|nr:protein 4.2-like [Sceloporus undulatus]
MGQALQVKRCHFQPAQNNQAHRTASISTERLVVRRGQPFTLTIHFAKPVPAGQWSKVLKATTLMAQKTGQWLTRAEGSLAQFPVASLGGQTAGWEAALESRSDLSWTVAVTSPADAPIGHYVLLLRQLSAWGARATQHPLGTFTLLFNPWCPGDCVFLGNEAQREEYILNEEGTIFWGLDEDPQQHPWDFGQFSEDFVDMSLALLDISLLWLQKETLCNHLRSPFHVCRLVNTMLNSQTHHPVLEGCWSGEYSRDGTPPSKWPGSGPILRQWLAGRCQPVRYGQCWVFAAVICSVLRSLGIPTRVVSNFASAQDTAGSLQVDELFDESAAMIPGTSEARVWPFHVWNECWMERGDLESGYGGWQALDATPQGQQSGLSRCCGPAPVRAIKEGRLDLPYDVGAFFAATNATRTAWVHQASGESKRAFASMKFVGSYISTKGVGIECCEDLTQHYKYPEGSPQEKDVFRKVCQLLGGVLPLPEGTEEPLLAAQIKAKSPLALGEEAQVSLQVANWTGQEKNLQVVLGAQPFQYNGKPLTQFWKEESLVSVPDGQEQRLSFTLPFTEYGPALRSSLLLRFTALLRDTTSSASQTRQPTYLAWQDIRLLPPELTLQVPEHLVQFQPAEATIQLHNPLPEPLPDCVVSLSGRGLIYRERHYRPGPVPAGGSVVLCLPFTPSQAGGRRLTARLEVPLLQHHSGCFRTTWVTAAPQP